MAPIPGNRAIKRLVPIYVPADGESFVVEYALCFDGTAWKRFVQVKGSATIEWVQLPAIPTVGAL